MTPLSQVLWNTIILQMPPASTHLSTFFESLVPVIGGKTLNQFFRL